MPPLKYHHVYLESLLLGQRALAFHCLKNRLRACLLANKCLNEWSSGLRLAFPVTFLLVVRLWERAHRAPINCFPKESDNSSKVKPV